MVLYGGLSFFNDERGYLGTDTGGKVATLEAMTAAGNLDPDVGYWAERWDPAGDLHPLWYTSRIGERWVNLTTLPATIAAAPLYRVGGYRLALLLPMLGSVLAAFGVRSIVLALGQPDGATRGWAGYWIAGLATPLAIYALDFWEHSLGVAAVVWAVRLLLPLVEGGGSWWRGAAAGALFAGAATMRTEALVYGAVAVGWTCGVLLVRQRRLQVAALTGGSALASLVAVTAAGYALELAVLGQLLRAGRTSGAASSIGAAPGTRIEEALLTAVSLHPGLDPTSYVIGLAAAALVAMACIRGRPGGDERMALICFAGAVCLFALRLVDGAGFVPGLTAATPLVVVALVTAPVDRRHGFVLAAALLPVPLVWATQFRGGAGPQWGARYLLPTALLLVAVAIARLPVLARPLRIGVVALGALVTAFGLAWLSIRSSDMADAQRALVALDEPVLVSTVAHLPREGGAFSLQQRWLTATTPAALRQAGAVLTEAGVDRFGLVAYRGRDAADVPGWRPTTTRVVPLFDGIDLEVRSYSRAVG